MVTPSQEKNVGWLWPDAMTLETFEQGLAFEVDDPKRDVCRHFDVRLRQHRELEALCVGVIDLDDAQRLGPRRLPHCKGVEAGSEQHILAYASC